MSKKIIELFKCVIRFYVILGKGIIIQKKYVQKKILSESV